MAGLFDEEPTVTKVSTPTLEQSEKNIWTTKQTGEWLFQKTKEDRSFCCLLYGLDGTGKSGIVQSYPLKNNEKIVILDLDGGNYPLLKYHPDKIDNIIVRNPLEVTEDGEIDYFKTIARIRVVVSWIKEHHGEENIKAVCIDGLSTLLKFSEYLMRVEKNIAPDGGVQLIYWIRRNKKFLETLDMIKGLPLDVFYIGHDDFIQDKDSELSSVKTKTNQMMYQKLRCIREEKPGKVIYKAIVDKCKSDVMQEGREIIFCTVDKEKKTFEWKGTEVLEAIGGKKDAI